MSVGVSDSVLRVYECLNPFVEAVNKLVIIVILIINIYKDWPSSDRAKALLVF